MIKHALPLSALLAVATLTATARADEGALILSTTLVKPLGEDGTVTESHGAGGDLVFSDDCLFVALGGYAAVGRPTDNKIRRDLFDFHVNFGFKPDDADGIIFPFATLGIDVLAMQTHDKTETLRGTTMGVNAMIGIAGLFADKKWIYKVNAAYLGAIVPGTGDDLGGLVLQAGLGKAFD